MDEGTVVDAAHFPGKDQEPQIPAPRSTRAKGDDAPSVHNKRASTDLFSPSNQVLKMSSLQIEALSRLMSCHLQLLSQTILLASPHGNHIAKDPSALCSNMIQRILTTTAQIARGRANDMSGNGFSTDPTLSVAVRNVPGATAVQWLAKNDRKRLAAAGSGLHATTQRIFEPHYIECLSPDSPEYQGLSPVSLSTRDGFNPGKDRLIAMGIERFGRAGLEKVVEWMLPEYKTVAKLKNRVATLKADCLEAAERRFQAAARKPENFYSMVLGKDAVFHSDNQLYLQQGRVRLASTGSFKWTRDHDRLLLANLKEYGPSLEKFEELAKALEIRQQDVTDRFLQLLPLL